MLGLRPCFIRREAACSRSLRVRRFWFARALCSTSAMSVLRQLPHDRGKIDPYIFPLDAAVLGEFDHVQQAEFERTVLADKAERPSRGATAPERLVDQEILAIEAAQAFDLAVG